MTKLGTVRTACLCIVAICLLTAMVNLYADNYKSHICATGMQLQQRQAVLPSEVIGMVLRDGAQQNNSNLSPWNYNWDLKVQDKPTAGIADRILILVRHGQYVLSTGKLTDLGRRQAGMTGLRLKEMNISFNSITHSTLERAMETAEIIHDYIPKVPLEKDDMLVEGGPIPPNPTVSYWKLPDRTYFTDGPRLEASFRKYFYRPDTNHKSLTYEILVGHGNIFRFFALRALQLQKDAWMRVFIAHASITMLVIRGDGTVSMTMFGDAGHFPHKDVSY